MQKLIINENVRTYIATPLLIFNHSTHFIREFFRVVFVYKRLGVVCCARRLTADHVLFSSKNGSRVQIATCPSVGKKVIFSLDSQS